MKELYYLVEPWEELQSGKHQAIAHFAVEKAKEHGVNLSVCVHNTMACEQFLEKCFSGAEARKLRRREEISKQGVSIKLESVKTLKNSYRPDPQVYLLLFPSPDLVKEVEAIDSAKGLIIFSETQHSEHLDEWKKEHDPQVLSAEG